ncbi:P22 phage major capsid protein family protein [Kitasatospora hibisci]|uniref:P22 phage major capsid protein family protein n=1 Tax=Kitasatospora hibisci TaxID=3369522 RepID=UPI0037551A5D
MTSPNHFEQSDIMARVGIGLLEAQLVLGRLVHRDAEKDFSGGVGSRVRVRLPNIVKAQAFTGSVSAIATQINERSVPVELKTHAVSAVDLTDEDLTLDIVDFGAQVLVPQTAGVGEFVEQTIAAEMNKLSTAANALEIDAAFPRKAVIAAGAVLDKAKVGNRRYLVVDADVKAAMLADPNLSAVDDAGSANTLREGVVGRLYGFDVYFSPFIKGAVAFASEAFALAVRAPNAPLGVAYAASVQSQGYALRYLRDFNSEALQERSIVSTFVGATTLDANRAVGLKLKSA